VDRFKPEGVASRSSSQCVEFAAHATYSLHWLPGLVDNLVRPFSLGVRLYASMFADHTVLGIFTGLTQLIVLLAFYTLGSIVCVIQAIIFVVLSMSYVRMAASHDH
jgi:F0F1-type ATP synthase membrane subunit a